MNSMLHGPILLESLHYPKQADIRYRVQLKARPHIIIYKVRSSDDTQDYDVTLVNGQVNNCTCPATKPCYHWRDVQAAADARTQERDEARTAYNNFELAMGI
jgi:hypothetical protein